MSGTNQNYLTHPKGIMSWLLTLDHKRIGLMYLFGGLFFFFIELKNDNLFLAVCSAFSLIEHVLMNTTFALVKSFVVENPSSFKIDATISESEKFI